jgi:3-oxoacyl-[acyl-carrier protein] reductase
MPRDRRVALVTGASRGIGAAIARRLGLSGFHVIVNHRTSPVDAEAIAAGIRADGGDSSILQADVTKIDEARRITKEIRTAHRRLDVLVNNAGHSEDGLLLLMPHTHWWSVFNDNVAAVINCTRATLPLLLGTGGGAIVNIASISGLRGVEGQTAYGAAKGAVIGFTRSLAREIATKGISVNCVAPGPIDTDMYRRMSNDKRMRRLEQMPLGRLGMPEEVAEVVNLLANGKAKFVHGQVISVDGGITG